MKKRSVSLVPLLVILFSVSAGASPITHENTATYKGVTAHARATVSSDAITIADSIELVVTVTAPREFIPQLPSFDAYGFSTDYNERSKRFRATDVSEIETQTRDDGSVQYTQRFVLEPFLSGNYAVLPMMISFVDAETPPSPKTDDSHSLRSVSPPAFTLMLEGFRIQVDKMAEARREPADIFGQADYQLETLVKRERRKEDQSDAELKREEEHELEEVRVFKERSFPWWMVWTTLVIAVAAPLIWVLSRKKIARIMAGKSLPAHEIAYKALEDLKAENLLGQGKIKEYYYALSYILRTYIGNRFGITAQNQTTEEFFLNLLKENPFDDESERVLRTFSEHSDSVKYSTYRPDIEKGASSFTIVKSFVDQTRLIEEEQT